MRDHREARATTMSQTERNRDVAPQACSGVAVSPWIRDGERQRARREWEVRSANQTHAGESEIHLPPLPLVAVSRSAQPIFEPSQNHSPQNHRYLLFSSYHFLQISKPCESMIWDSENQRNCACGVLSVSCLCFYWWTEVTELIWCLCCGWTAELNCLCLFFCFGFLALWLCLWLLLPCII